MEIQSGVAVWTIDGPDSKNALDFQALASLVRVASEASQHADVRCAVLTGAGDTFSSGGDLRELRHLTSTVDATRLAEAGGEVVRAFRSLPFPVVAALPGAAIGGGAELALACDLRMASPSAMLSLRHVRLGTTPAWGTFARLVELAGPSTAADLFFSGRDVDASEARSIRLFDRVSAPGEALDLALAWAMDVAQGSPAAIRAMKGLFATMSNDPKLTAAERDAFVETWASPDHAEAVEAYFHRRPPSFRR